MKKYLFTALAAVTLMAAECNPQDAPKPTPVITITNQPLAATANFVTGAISGSLTVTATVTQEQTLSYQWFCNTTNSATGGTELSGATTATLVIPTTLAQATHYLYCQISATGGATPVFSDVVKINVLSPGGGTATDPYKVYDETTLRKVGTGSGWTLGAHYQQICNITLTGTFTSIGASATPFSGSYDGRGYSILDLNIPATTETHQGLFKNLTGAVRNVALINVNVSESTDGGENYVGAIAGANFGIIENCYVTGSVTGQRIVGGIVAYNYAGTVKNCYTTCTVTSSGNYAGGIAGYNRNNSTNYATIASCYATGNIKASNYAGGIAGYNSSSCTIDGCVALNKEVMVDAGNTLAGRITGSNTVLTNNFARTSGMMLNGGITVTPDATGKHGADVSAANINGANAATWWSGAEGPGFSASVWSFDTGRLPHLKTTNGAPFDQAQTPAI